MCKDSDWLVVTRGGMAVRFNTVEVSCIGRAAKGVKAISLEKGDTVVMASPVGEQDDLAIFTDFGFREAGRKRVPL